MEAGIRLAAAAQHGVGESVAQRAQSGGFDGLERSSWTEIAQRVGQQLKSSSSRGNQPELRAQQLTQLLHLQVDVSRYHLKVEMLSKVAESAVASLRKLQQPQ
jgi:hypothetical protein